MVLGHAMSTSTCNSHSHVLAYVLVLVRVEGAKPSISSGSAPLPTRTCGSNTQTVVLETIARVGREVKWGPFVTFNGNEIRRLADLLDTAPVSFEGATDGSNPLINKKLATEAVVKILPGRVKFAVRQIGKEGESIDKLLKHMSKDMSEGEVHRDFLKAAEAQPKKRPYDKAAEEQQSSD